MDFDKNNCTVETCTLEGETVEFLAYRTLPYVDAPVDLEYQRMSIFVPAVYRDGGEINGYTGKTAPIFMPNTVGGYMPGPLDEPGAGHFGPMEGEPNSIFRALQHGYVVAATALRGRTLRDSQGRYTGKAPACLVDYKAAVRFLRHIRTEIYGDTEKIVTNGTSAGGALSSLMGATGNAPEYEPYLKAIGAASERDDVFAASCYCPITNLDHADMAYEWQFANVWDYKGAQMEPDGNGGMKFTPVEDRMTDRQIGLSKELAKQFPAYVNSLGLTDTDGCALTLNSDGTGGFLKFIESMVLDSANAALAQGKDLSGKDWLTLKNGQAAAMDFAGYVRDITRMKVTPAFDDLAMHSPENDLFGSGTQNCRHFTEFSQQHDPNGLLADPETIGLMNPMTFLKPGRSTAAKHWRIRHGECDRDTSLAISSILTLTLRSLGCEVDYYLPWNTPHSGDYDLPELFAWIDGLCR